MRNSLLLLALAAIAQSQETPLRALPYTPSLEMKFVDVAAYVASEHKSGVNGRVLFSVEAEPDLDNSAQMMGRPRREASERARRITSTVTFATEFPLPAKRRLQPFVS
jgi:hypothetical protein